ncbi:beta-catenin-interacting protein 1 isoform X1 [Passer domesticus]|uniref:beta-catenin-interacting protein 1 isoform X1 n=1 Tax=Passer domesticus TaxID=48849 RepID=UPI0030FE43E6
MKRTSIVERPLEHPSCLVMRQVTDGKMSPCLIAKHLTQRCSAAAPLGWTSGGTAAAAAPGHRVPAQGFSGQFPHTFFPAPVTDQDCRRGLSDLLWFLEAGHPGAGRRGMNREGVPGKSPEEMYIQQKVRVLLMLRKMGSNLTASEEEFLRTYAGVVNSQLSQLPQHSIDQGAEDVVMAFSRSETEDRRQ